MNLSPSRTTLLLLPLALLATGCLGEARTVQIEERSLAAESLAMLHLDVGAGDLDVVGDPAASAIEVSAFLRTNLALDNEDGAAREAFDLLLEERDGEAWLELPLSNAPAGYYADVVVTLPSGMGIEGRDGSGDARLSDLAAVWLTDDSGDLELRRIAGPVTLTDDSGDILVDEVQGSVTVDDDSGNIRVLHVSEEVEITDGSGDIHVGSVEGRVRIRDGSGDIVAEDVGELEILEDGSGDVIQR